MDNMIYWIWLSLSVRPSGTSFGRLICELPDAKSIYEADDKKISSIIGYRNSDRSALADKCLDKAESVLSFCRKHNVGILIYGDSRFPDSLRKIKNPPVLLYYRGVLPDFNRGFFVGAVGTRSISEYGRRSTFKISFDLASAGATIVSGMAIGIDGVASAAALAAGGSTVAVIGSGIDVCYPPQHLKLAREIVKTGCVLTEYAPGTQPSKYTFPQRNRIISGLSAATVVFEGPERSGALITARSAKEQERVLYALPGNVGAKNSQLSNLLLKNGAKMCTTAEDVLSDFESAYPGIINAFLLKDRPSVDMMEALRVYGVCATCPSDDIFINPDAPLNFAKKRKSIIKSPGDIPVEAKELGNETAISPPDNFNASALAIYKKIPLGESVAIESLTDENNDLRAVMKSLLMLEMGGFITMLPGEMVSRKTI